MAMPQKRRRRRRSPLQEGVSRRRPGEDGASLSGSLVDSDSSSSRLDGGSPPPGLPDEPVTSSTESRYHEIIASRLAQLQLPVGDDGSDMAGFSNLPPIEILEVLARKSFHDDYSRAALLECQCQKFLNETQGRNTDSGESDSAIVDTGSTYTEPGDVITEVEHMRDCELLGAAMDEIDTWTKLDQEQANKLHLKYALYRIKACLLLKGKPVDELDDDVALERKYPPELIVKNKYFFHYEDDLFGWYFDAELCYKASLSDYQRLVLLNDGDEYSSWRRYQTFYSTPEADRDYLSYWETIAKELKWLEQYLLTNESSIEWAHKHSKATFQAIRIASKFPCMTLKLAAVGLHEYIWNARIHLMFVKDLDGILYNIWRRLNADHQLRFRDALKQVYEANLFPAHDRSMKYELEYGDSKMDLVFVKCTTGLSDGVPEDRARELIKQEIRWTRESSGTYERYARKKLKIAELIGLIPKDKIATA
ncbi:uncharacterized protein LOC119281060 [Triticum dicoccoides]|uniref:uncharacterized protein LOC119281060 n=1 Tax=Triticum dicoccoides TaxID=85692 RepID=UPI00188FF3FC|nr:uncharacterized protein LOC119281060 [Triticum dicoccoides]